MFPPDPVLAPEARRGDPSQGRAYDAPKMDLRLEWGLPCSQACAGKLQVAQEVSTMRQPTACIKLERARRAGPKPARGAASAMSPSLTLLPCPAGQPPFEAHRGNTSAAPGAATLSAHRRVSTPYPLSSVVSGAVLPPGHKSRSHCRALRLLRHRLVAAAVADPVAGQRFKSPAKSRLLRCCPSTGCAPTLMGSRAVNTAGRERAPFLTWGNRRRHRVCLTS